MPVVSHRLEQEEGFETRVLGNLAGVQEIPAPRYVRNHAMIVPISVGTPSQQLTCMLDASSADLWIPSRRCSTCATESREQSSFFEAKQSSTFGLYRPADGDGGTENSVRMLYGGGSIRGIIGKDRVALGDVAIPDQPFLLATDDDSGASSADVAWDGVCGIGWGSSIKGPPLWQSLGKVGKRSLFMLSPGNNKPEEGDIGRFFPGMLYGPESRMAYVQSLKSDGSKNFREGSWAVNGTVEIRHGGESAWSSPGRIAFETGTSYLLVPPYRYLKMMRTLLPNGAFERLCGLAKKAGNVVVCDCSAQRLAKGEIVLRFMDSQGVVRDFPLHGADLFEPVSATSPDMQKQTMCIPQVQQRPHSADLDSPTGILGSPFEKQSFFKDPAAFLSAFVGPVARSRDGKAPGAMPLDPFLQALLENSRIKEVIKKRLRDGTTCETRVNWTASGSFEHTTTKAWDKHGKDIEKTKALCSQTRDMAKKVEGMEDNVYKSIAKSDDDDDDEHHRRLETTGEEEEEVWVLGHVFLKRYSVFFDFEYGQVGLVRPPPNLDVRDAVRGAEVEAFEPGGASQTMAAPAAEAALPDESGIATDSLPAAASERPSREIGTVGIVFGLLGLALLVGTAVAVQYGYGEPDRPRGRIVPALPGRGPMPGLLQEGSVIE